jgi:hypothetical protein
MLLDMAGSQQALKAKKHYKNPNEIHQFTNLPIYKFTNKPYHHGNPEPAPQAKHLKIH